MRISRSYNFLYQNDILHLALRTMAGLTYSLAHLQNWDAKIPGLRFDSFIDLSPALPGLGAARFVSGP